MTTIDERTKSVVGAGEFLEELSRDRLLPEHILRQAKQLLRHYPSAQDIWRAGRLEIIRQEEIGRFRDISISLYPALAIWTCCEPFFCDAKEHERHGYRQSVHLATDLSHRDEAGYKLSNTESLVIGIPPIYPQVCWPVARFRKGCLSADYQCFVARREQTLVYASKVFGSPELARYWLEKPALGLEKREPCRLLSSDPGYVIVMKFLAKIEYGIY
ncbi:BPSL0761 family protein [Pseudomonas amygdali]|uniref:BPSL0761 family protein n=1 Tax=Pseudomonas amygdali TaxID=47877 RepID=UPI001604E599|nr:BPSL0761 family protein [Pseudomonas amygdali]